jgi:hypothetical protein
VASPIARGWWLSFPNARPAFLEVISMRSVFPSLSLVTTLAPLFALSCSSPAANGNDSGAMSNDAGDGGCVPYNPSPSSLMTPSVSFANDVMPVFVHSCAFSGCHITQSADGGPPPGNLEFLFVQEHTAPIAMYAQQVYDGLLNRKTIEDPTMNFVTPGDPANSYLMRKMDFALCDIAAQCDSNNPLFKQYNGPDKAYPAPTACGVVMPPDLYDPVTNAMLPLVDDAGMPTQREMVKRWIAQGAKFN